MTFSNTGQFDALLTDFFFWQGALRKKKGEMPHNGAVEIS